MIRLKHPVNNTIEECPTGFSWTTLFFGAFVPLIRGDVKWLIILAVVNLCTYGLASIAFAFFYNKIYLKNQLEKGFVPAGDIDNAYLVGNGYTMAQ